MKKLFVGVFAFALSLGFQANAELLINELMQSNIDCIMDDLNEFPDSWVELYNPGPGAVNLADYMLGVKEKLSKAWQLPSKTVNAGSYVIIYCDKVGDKLHADFRLESGKDGAVYLFKGSSVVDQITGMKKMPAPNIAYGRVHDGASDWGYQATPTPGKANCGTVYSKVLPEPEFSEKGRVASTALQLRVTVPAGAPAGTVVRYTTDGSEPTASSPVLNGAIYISSTRIVKAVLTCDGYLSPRPTAQSYIFFPRQMTLPIISITAPGKYFYDSKLGILADGTGSTKNYEYDWRRPVNVEIFMEPGKPSVINQLVETRVKGGASRGAKMKSLVVYANKRFGTKRLEYEFFPDDAPGITDWKSIELRNAGNDFDYLYFRDAYIQSIMGRSCDLDWQPYRPAIFMINGEYKGMLNMRSRTNEDYIYSMYDGLEDAEVIENNWEVKEGSGELWKSFQDFYGATGHTFAEFDRLMDTGEYANLMIMNLFFDNKDFPGNNIVCWRPTADSGRWRWIAKDTDFGLGLYGVQHNYKTIHWLYDNNYDPDRNWANKPEHTRLFRRLMATPEFKEMFISRAAVYLGDFLTVPKLLAHLDNMREAIRYEYPNHRKLVNEWWPNYDTEMNAARTWINGRVNFFYDELNDYYKLGTPRSVTVDPAADASDGVKLTINGVELRGRSFNGKYFQGKTMTVTAVAPDGRVPESWKVITSSGTVNHPGATLSYTVTDKSARIESVFAPMGIADATSGSTAGIDYSQPYDVYDLQGRHLGTSIPTAPGIYIIRQGAATEKVIR